MTPVDAMDVTSLTVVMEMRGSLRISTLMTVGDRSWQIMPNLSNCLLKFVLHSILDNKTELLISQIKGSLHTHNYYTTALPIISIFPK